VSQRSKPDDDADFARAMKDVVRLPTDPRGRARKAPHVDPPPRRDELAATGEPATPDEPAADSYAAPGIDRRELRRLKRGEYRVQARLDLHGMTAPEARDEVIRLLQQSRQAGHRCVCIVHGRGLNSAGGVAVLKAQVRHQLARAPAVLAFTSAPPSGGGSGAVYVLLRR
jgi:DNA-nicking Smr family endonuclease